MYQKVNVSSKSFEALAQNHKITDKLNTCYWNIHNQSSYENCKLDWNQLIIL